MAHHPALRMGFDVLKITLGACCVAAGVVLFLAPNQVVPGGFVGASFLLDHVLNVPLSLSYLIFNAVLIGLGVQVLGRGEFLAKTLWGIMANPRVQDLTALEIPDAGTAKPVIAGKHHLTQIWCLEGNCQG